MHYNLVIITNSKINNSKLNTIDYYITNNQSFLVNDFELNNKITFDFLITDSISSLKNIDILIEDEVIICNYFLQTSKEHIFFIGKENNSSKTIDEQLDIVLDFLFT